MKKKIITITGDLASGKSTVCDILCERLNYTKYSNGIYFRKLAKKYNMDVTSFGKYVQVHPDIDREIENNTKEYVKDHENLIIDARLGFYSVPESFKIYLKVDLEVSAFRALNDEKRKDTENFNTLEEQKEDIKLRYELENKRYKKIYNVDRTNMDNYDLVIDTTDKTIEEVVNTILEEYEKWIND